MACLLTPTIHEVSTAAGNAPYPAVFSRLEVLDVLSSTSRAPRVENPTEYVTSPTSRQDLMNSAGCEAAHSSSRGASSRIATHRVPSVEGKTNQVVPLPNTALTSTRR